MSFNRRPTIFTLEQEDIVPDLVTIAKGLGGGFQPTGAVMLSRRIYQAFGRLAHSLEKGAGHFGCAFKRMGHEFHGGLQLVPLDRSSEADANRFLRRSIDREGIARDDT